MKSVNIGELVLRWRREIGLLLALTTGIMALYATKVEFTTRFFDFFPADHANVKLAQRFPGYGGAETLALMLRVKKGDIFNTDTLKKIQDISKEVDWLPGVNHQEVFSLASYRVAYAQAVPGGLNVRPFMYPSVPRNQSEIEALKQQIFSHHEGLRHLISADNKSTLITGSFNEEGLNYRELFTRILAIVANNQDSNHTIYVAGEPVVRGYGYYYFPAIVAIFLAACLIVVLILYLNLGAYSSWWVPLVTGCCSALWGLGFVGLMHYVFDPLMLVVPFILTARDMSHAIQWQRRYYSVLNHLEDRHAACVTTTDLMLVPGLVAIAADVAGIIFISLSGIPVLNHIARAGTVWLAASLLMVFIFQPIMMSYLPKPRHRRWNEEHLAPLERQAEALADRLVEVPVTPGARRALILWGAVGLLIFGVVSALKIQVGYNTPGTPLYRPDAKVNTDTDAIGREFPVDEAWVIATTPRYPDAQSTLGPNVLRMADHLRNTLLHDPAVLQVISFASTVISPFNQMFHYGHPKFFGMPSSPQQAGNLWYLYLGGTAPGEMEHFISNTEAKDTCVRVLLRDHTDQTLVNVQREIGDFVGSYVRRNRAYSKIRVLYMAGLAGLYAAANEVLYRVELINIALVLGCVFIFCSALFGSFLAGVLFVFACVLANFAAFIYMYLSGIGLTIDTLPVISLAIGLGVDYGISTVSRIRAEVITEHRLDDAIRVALRSTGGSVLTTFCVMIGGILPWTLSPALFHHHMGVLLTILLATNVLAGVWILPAFISWFRPDFICRHEWGQVTAIEQLAARLAAG